MGWVTSRMEGGGCGVVVLRLSHAVTGGQHRVQAELDGVGSRQTATAEFEFVVGPGDAEGIRWYLEDFLDYPVDPAPRMAARVEQRLVQIGSGLFEQVFGTRDGQRLWDRAQAQLQRVRVEVAGDPAQGVGLPWELLRDPVTEVAVALRAESFVRTHSQPAQPVDLSQSSGGDRLRVLLVICRPEGRADVPFRSVASHLVRSDAQTAVQGLDLDVLRPPTFGQLSRVLHAAAQAGRPYHVVHFDGHGTYTDLTTTTDHAGDGGEGSAVTGNGGGVEVAAHRYATVAPPRPGRHGYLVFEQPAEDTNQELVDGPTLGALLAQTGVAVLVLNACRSAYAEVPTQPATSETSIDSDGPGGDVQPRVAAPGDVQEVHARVRAYGSLAAEVADAGVPGVVAMRYNVYVVTAAQFIAELYAGLLAGRGLGEAVTAARRQLAANPRRQIAFDARALQDWSVPLVFEAGPLTLFTPTTTAQGPVIQLHPPEQSTTSDSDAGGADSSGMVLPRRPDVGFHGRDETLLALDRAFDTHPVVLLHALAGSGKTTTVAEFARWYQTTGGLDDQYGQPGVVLFTSFEHHRALARVLAQFGDAFDSLWAANDIAWHTLTPVQQRDLTLQVVGVVPVLWIWDNIEPITGFPPGAPSPWTPAEQSDLAEFLRDLADTQCKVLLTSRRDEHTWLGDLPVRVGLPAMPMRERFQLTQALAKRQGHRLIDVADWRPLLRYSAGNPLTLTVLVGHALRQHLTTRDHIDQFVAQLQTGHTTLETDQDRALGRSASLAASLDYGFTHAFTEVERAQLAVLHLFRDTIDADALVDIGSPNNPHQVPQLAGITREGAISLLDQAADIGLLTPLGAGYYTIHPALPWYFTTLFTQNYGPPDQPDALNAAHAYTHTLTSLGNYYHDQYGAGRAQVIPILALEEANLLHALHLAHIHHGYDIIGAAQGLRTLYEHQGRSTEWARIVDQLTTEFIDPTTDQPLPGHETHYSLITQYRAGLAHNARDWPTATRLQHHLITWNRHQAATALASPPDQLDNTTRNHIRSLAVSLHQLGEILREQGDPGCLDHYHEATDLFQSIDARREQAIVELHLGHAYLDIPTLRNPDRAQQAYHHSLFLLDDHDHIGRAVVAMQLGKIDRFRFYDARAASADEATLRTHLTNALRHYHHALTLLPHDDITNRATTHQQLGNTYADAGDLPAALTHYQQSITHYEASGNTYGAGNSRYNVALMLAQAGRTTDALDWAHAALRDFQHVGPGATTDITQTQQLIQQLHQRPNPHIEY